MLKWCPTISQRKDLIFTEFKVIKILLFLWGFIHFGHHFLVGAKRVYLRYIHLISLHFPINLNFDDIYYICSIEAKKYKQCSSCQIGNQIGIIFKRVI